jgi:hypothetical protein
MKNNDMCITEERVKEVIHQELGPFKRDFNIARNWVIGLFGTLILGVFGMGVWVGGIDTRVTNNTLQQERAETRVEDRLVRIENLLINLTEKVGKNNSQ